MKTKRTKKGTAMLAILALTLTTLLSSLVAAGAYMEVPTYDSDAIADNSSRRTITVYKYAVDNLDQGGQRGDGTHVADPAGEPIEGIYFELIRVIPRAGHSLTNPLVQREGEAWDRDNAFTPVSLPTEGAGRVVFDLGIGRANDGIYLIRELSDPRIVRPVDPFFVHVPMTRRVGEGANREFIYNIVVQPKNVEMFQPDPRKTINGKPADSIIAGESFQWELTSNVPTDLVMTIREAGVLTYTYRVVLPDGTIEFRQGTRDVEEGELIHAKYFEIEDTLNPELILEEAIMQVRVGAGDWVDLVLGIDFTLEMNGTPVTAHPVTNTPRPNPPTDTHMLFALTPAGMERIAYSGYTQIRAVLTTHVREDFNGVIPNTFTVRYLGPDWRVDGTEDNNGHPEYYTGGYNLLKVNETGDALEGAVFHIATSLDNANNGVFLTTTGAELTYGTAVYPEGATNAGESVVFVTATSGSDGRASFHGLPLNVPAGFVPSLPPAQCNRHLIYRNYWVVETTSPAGFELLGAPLPITVTVTSHLNVNDLTEVLNRAITFLPFTGGAGLFILVGFGLAAITTGTTAFAMDKRRRQKKMV